MKTKEKQTKDRIVSFRINEEDFKSLEKLSKVSGAGTAHSFARELTEKALNTVGAFDIWSGNNEKKS